MVSISSTFRRHRPRRGRNRIRVLPLSLSLFLSGFLTEIAKTNTHVHRARERERESAFHETRTRKNEEEEDGKQRERERDHHKNESQKRHATHCVRVIGPLGSIANGLPPKLPLALCGTFLRNSYSRATSASYCGSTPRGTTPGPMDAECDVREGSIFFYMLCVSLCVCALRFEMKREKKLLLAFFPTKNRGG